MIKQSKFIFINFNNNGLFITLLLLLWLLLINRDKFGSPDYSEDDDDEQQLSGDFINDGAFTQASPSIDTGLSMYHSLYR